MHSLGTCNGATFADVQRRFVDLHDKISDLYTAQKLIQRAHVREHVGIASVQNCFAIVHFGLADRFCHASDVDARVAWRSIMIRAICRRPVRRSSAVAVKPNGYGIWHSGCVRQWLQLNAVGSHLRRPLHSPARRHAGRPRWHTPHARFSTPGLCHARHPVRTGWPSCRCGSPLY